MIRVVIADDHNIVRQGLRALIEKESDIVVLGESEDGFETINKCKELNPDVLITDINMPNLDGIQVIDQLKSNGVKVKIIILSMYSDDLLIKRAIQSGASGYLVKQSVTEELLLAIRAAVNGDIYLSPKISRKIISETFDNENDDYQTKFQSLTPREKEILQLISEGNINREIATLLTISTKTVEKHRASLMKKLDVHDIPSLIKLAIKYKLIFIE